MPQRILIFFILWVLIARVRADVPLVDAVEKQNQAGVQVLLASDLDINATQVDGMTALHWAVYHNDTSLAVSLLERGASVAAENRYGVTPLSLACVNGNEKIVDLLLSKGADANSKLLGGETALMTAARTGNVATVKSLILKGAEVNAKERKGQTALMWAAAEGNLEVVSALLDAGADFRTHLPSGFTALFFAVREGRTAVVKRLLSAGEDVNTRIETEKGSGRFPAVGTSPLMLAVENGHFDLAMVLLETGADPNDQRNGLSVLHALAMVRKPDRGDDIESAPPPNGSGTMTSLQFVRELIARGADVNLRLKKGKSGKGDLSRKGATPFLLAADTADIPFMRLLIELGADPLLPNDDQCTPLMAAAGIGTKAPGEEAGTEDEALEAVVLIVEHGGELNTVDENGETAMHGAAYKSAPRIVEYLATHGADIQIWNLQDKHGWTPLKIAEGYRPGNFRPAADTMAAIQRVMKAAGVEPVLTSKSSSDESSYSK